MEKWRIVDILGRYVDFDLESCEPQYVREVLVDVCGCTKDELVELGFDYLWPDGNVGET